VAGRLLAVIRAVLFDLDETLILDEAVCDHAFRIAALSVTSDLAVAAGLAAAAASQARALWAELPAVALEYATRIGHSAFEGLWAEYDASIPAEALLEGVITEYREHTWQLALETCGLSGDPARLSRLWIQLRSRYPLYPDADDLLVRLYGKYKLGIVTNGVRRLQRRKLTGCGLLPWFDAVAVSGEVGTGKPDPGIFAHIAKQLAVPLESCLMVGDNASRDVQGGVNAGMRTVWVDRGFKPGGPAPTLKTHNLMDILPWVESQP
jgi:HAD superfamily hydrolase (TIGR01509 family)